MIDRQHWTDHRFNLGLDVGWTKNVLSRIRDTSIRMEYYVRNLSDDQLSYRENEKWSIKEHIGHLTDLESLWMNRFEQFANGASELVAADMSNTKTEQADHNISSIHDLLDNFIKARQALILSFKALSEDVQYHEAFHPRIKMTMRPVDLLFFIAEHDDHHLVSIQEINSAYIADSTYQRFMVTERFHRDKIRELYQRFDEQGRMLPKGVIFIDSWIDEDLKTCFQLMESESKEKLNEWINNWKDVTDFEITSIISSPEAKKKALSNE